jgi:AcrR family transcriptional regulator
LYTVYTSECTPYTQQMARLDRQTIVDAALELADDVGLEAVSLRNIAELLRVTPMALYRHVENKDALLDAMADELYAELDPKASTGDWWAGLAGIARKTRALLLAHPWAVPLFSRPLAGPHGRTLAQALESNLRDAGFSKADAAELHDQLSNLVFALVAPELHGKRNRAAFERGLELLHAGLEARLRQQ